MPTKTGDYYALKTCNNKNHVIRLLEFIPGTLLHQIQPTDDLLYQAGQFIAQLDLTMKVKCNFYNHLSVVQLTFRLFIIQLMTIT